MGLYLEHIKNYGFLYATYYMYTTMGKVHPQFLSCFDSSFHFTSKQETFTLWMKSLVFNGKGCTVYDSNGQIMYRVDNYNSKCRDEVYLMDNKGDILFTVLRKKFKFSTFWYGYRSTATENDQKKPSFRVRKTSKIPIGVSFYEITLGMDEDQPYCYKMQSNSCKSGCKIQNQFGGLVAELKRKKSYGGVDLGHDVLSMIVEPIVDLSLIMGLVVAYSLINCKM